MKAAAPPSRTACLSQLVALAPRHRDHVVAGGGEPSRDRKADAAAAAGDENIMHRVAPAFRPPSHRAPRRSGSPPAPCATPARPGNRPTISSRMSSLRLLSPPSARTTSATTIAPVIGLRRDRARDIRTSAVPVDDGFDLLGMNLQAADIDDAAAPADEVVAVAAQLDHVAGVDEAIGVGQRRGASADIGVRGARASGSGASRPRSSSRRRRGSCRSCRRENPRDRRSRRSRRRLRSRHRHGRSRPAGKARPARRAPPGRRSRPTGGRNAARSPRPIRSSKACANATACRKCG